MRRTLDFAGNLPFSQWSELLKDQVEHLLVAAAAHDDRAHRDHQIGGERVA